MPWIRERATYLANWASVIAAFDAPLGTGPVEDVPTWQRCILIAVAVKTDGALHDRGCLMHRAAYTPQLLAIAGRQMAKNLFLSERYNFEYKIFWLVRSGLKFLLVSAATV
jgi:hypothetical protein